MWPIDRPPQWVDRWDENGAMAYDRQWIIDLLQRLGYAKEADAAAQALPDQVSADELKKFGDQYGISHDELISRMGGSP